MGRPETPAIHAGFVSQAMASPDGIALAIRDQEWTYSELDWRARNLACTILDRTPKAPERIGVFTYRTELAYTGTLAALYAGATFVPLNKQFPVDRTVSMIEQADLQAIIVDGPSQRRLVEVQNKLSNPPLIIAPGEGPTAQVPGWIHCDLADRPVADVVPTTVVEPDQLAYLLFTSGTTGKPKGVMITHSNARAFLEAISPRYGLTRHDRTSQTFDQTFDLSVFDIFVTWEAGARLCVLQNNDLLAPARFVNQHQLTMWFSVPSVVAYMQRARQLKPGLMPSLRWSLFCGEALPRRAAEAWAEAAPNSAIENLYGPTEATIACTAYRWDRDHSGKQCLNDVVPIGAGLEGIDTLLLDESDRQADPGELCVGGAQVSPGYWRDSAKTAERFLDRLDDRGVPRRYYRTGDRATRLPTGDLAYLGRTDFQLKVSGYRVEVAEVEAVLLRHASVAAAAVVGWPVEAGAVKGMVAFVVGDNPPVDDLSAQLREALPPYAVPREIVALPAFPLNANGKIDRNALVDLLLSRDRKTGI